MSRRAECFGCGEFLKAGTACRSCKNMKTKPNSGTVSVSRELLESAMTIVQRNCTSNWSADIRDRLQALLTQPADQQGEPYAYAYEHDGMIHNELHQPTLTISRWPEVKEPFTEVALYSHAQPATAKVALPEREVLRDIIAQAIGGDAYDCTRVWAAWGVGTMSEEDFVPIVDQEARLYELVDACLDEVAKLNGGQS